ncbi:hypothetical protein ACILFA_07305, partial [Capnocytophaga canimorsus]
PQSLHLYRCLPPTKPALILFNDSHLVHFMTLNYIKYIRITIPKNIQVSTEMRTFTSPEIDLEAISEKRDFVTISFKAIKEIVNRAKKHSGSKSNKEFGEYLLHYYLKMEDLEDE